MEDCSALSGVVLGESHIGGQLLERSARRAANGFAAFGIRPGDTIALLLRNAPEFFVATLGAQAAGAYPVPLNWHNGPEEIAYVLKDCGARLVVAHADLYARLKDGVPADCRVLVIATPPEVARAFAVPPTLCGIPTGAMDWSAWLEEQSDAERPVGSMRGSIIYTSGTTGKPKGVVRAPAEGEARERMLGIVDEIMGVPRDRPVRSVITGPLYHPAPNFSGMRSVDRGSLAVIQPKFDELALLEMIERYRITHLNMVPTMFIRLLRLDKTIRNRFDVSSIERVTHAAAPCPVEVKQEMIAWWGPVIHEFYGGTETGTVTIHNSEEALRRPGTVGRPLNNCVVRVLDEQGEELPAGEIGEIFARNYNMPDFNYLGMPDKREEVQRGELITIGDVGFLDESGYLFLCDRKRDMIISGGVNIYPAEIESLLVTMPGVKDCAVFGVPDAEFGEAVCAHVELMEDATLDIAAIQAWLRARMASYKVPRLIKLDQDLPREDSGKIMKKRLRASYWETAGRSI